MRVKPADGRALRWPGTLRLLKYSGEDVPETAFWLRAKEKGDVVEADASSAGDEPAPGRAFVTGVEK